MHKKKKTKKINKVSINAVKEKVVVTSTTDRNDYLALPTAHIKSDLIGMLLFALVALLGIMLLKKYNISLELILNYFASLR